MSEDSAFLAAAINDDPDPAHGDYTPAVHALVGQGLAALPAVFPLLESEDQWTRLRAQRVLEGVTRGWVRTRTPSRPATGRADQDWLELWQKHGNYDWIATPQARAEALSRWRAWLAAQGA